MTVLGSGLIFQPVLLACTHNNDTIITLQKKINITDLYQSLHKKLKVQAEVIGAIVAFPEPEHWYLLPSS